METSLTKAITVAYKKRITNEEVHTNNSINDNTVNDWDGFSLEGNRRNRSVKSSYLDGNRGCGGEGGRHLGDEDHERSDRGLVVVKGGQPGEGDAAHHQRAARRLRPPHLAPEHELRAGRGTDTESLASVTRDLLQLTARTSDAHHIYIYTHTPKK